MIIKTIVVNIKLEKPDVYIGRGSSFGNPFPVHNGEFSFEDSMRLYENYLIEKIKTDSKFKTKFLALKGKKIGCFCKKYKSEHPKYSNDKTICHGDIIVKILNSNL